MSDLRSWRMNAGIEADLMSRPIFDPASLDGAPRPPLIDLELLELNEPSLDPDAPDDVSLVGGGLGPRAPWEVLP